MRRRNQGRVVSRVTVRQRWQTAETSYPPPLAAGWSYVVTENGEYVTTSNGAFVIVRNT